MRKEMEEAVPPRRPCDSGSNTQPRITTPKRPISPPPSSQPSALPVSPANSHNADVDDQGSRIYRGAEAGTTSSAPGEADSGGLTPREKVKLLKICYKHGYGILNAPLRCKRSEDESYQPVLEEFSAQVRAGFFKTCAEVHVEVKKICRNRRRRRRRTKGEVILAKRSPEPAPDYDASIDRWVRVWDFRMLKIYLDKVYQLMSETLRILRPRVIDDELLQDLSDLILEPRARKAYRKHMAAVVRPGRAGSRHSPESSMSDDSSLDSSDEEIYQNEMASANDSPTPLHSIEQDVGSAPSPSSLEKRMEPVYPTQPSDELMGVFGEYEELTIAILEKARQDGKGKNVSIRGLELPDTENERHLSLTPVSRVGNDAECSYEVGSSAATTDASHGTEWQRSPSLGIRPLSFIMNLSPGPTPRRETTTLPDLRNSPSSGPNISQVNRKTITHTSDRKRHKASPAAPKASHRSVPPKTPSLEHTRIDPREIKPSMFYGLPSERDNLAGHSQSLAHEGYTTTAKFSLPDPFDTPTSTPRRPFKHHADSVLGDSHFPRPHPKHAYTSSGVAGGRSYDGVSDSEGLPDLEELAATHFHHLDGVTGRRKRQRAKGSRPPSQRSGATHDENQGTGRCRSQETNRHGIPSPSTARSRPLSEQPASKSNTPNLTFSTNDWGRAGHAIMSPGSFSPHGGPPPSETLTRQKGRDAQVGDSQQARKRKKSPRSPSRGRRHLASASAPGNTNSLMSPMAAQTSSSSPALERRPRKRQRQLSGKPVGDNSLPNCSPAASPRGGERECGKTADPMADTDAGSDSAPRTTIRSHSHHRRNQGSEAFHTPAKQTSRGPESSPASSNLFVSSGSLTPGMWRTKRRKRKSDRLPQHRRQWILSGHEGGEGGKYQERAPNNNKRMREMTATTTDFEQLSPGRKYEVLRGKNKQLENKIYEIERRLGWCAVEQ